MNFLRKTFVSQIFPLSRIFSDTGRKMFKTLSYFLRQGHRKSNLCVQRYIVTKNKMFQMFQRMVFFYNCLRIMIERFALSKKNNSLGSKNSILCVQRNVLGANFCIKKLFFCKNLSGIEGKYFWFLGKLFPARLSSFQSTFAEEDFREIFLEKSFFHCFQNWSKKIDYWKSIKMNVKTLFYVSVGFFLGTTFF